MNQKSAFIIGAAVVISAVILGIFFYSARSVSNTIRVTGYATEEFQADVVKWNFQLSSTVSLDRLTQGYDEMREKLTMFRKIWNSKNLKVDEFNIQPIQVQKRYGEYGKITGNILQQNIYIISKEIDSIEKIAINPDEFTKNNIAFEYSRIEYFSTHLPELKKQLLSLAMINARERANEIVSAAGGSIEKLRSAYSGVFQITEPFSTEISGYGMYNTSSRKKSIKVTVTATFALK